MSSFWMPKKQPLYAPMIASFGGGSSKGFGQGRSAGINTAEALANVAILQPNIRYNSAFSTGDLTTLVSDVIPPSFPDGDLKEIKFDPTGTKMYLKSYSGYGPAQYSLSSAWNPSNATYLGQQNFGVTSTGVNLIFDMCPDGYHVLFGNRSNISLYKLTTQWDLLGGYTTLSWNPAGLTNMQNAGFTGDLKGVWAYGRNNDSAYYWSMSKPLDYANLSSIPTSSASNLSFLGTGSSTNAYGMQMSGDGTALALTDYSTAGKIHVQQITTPYDITTISQNISYFKTFVGATSVGNMGLTLIKVPGTNQGRAYIVNQYSTKNITSNQFTWAY